LQALGKANEARAKAVEAIHVETRTVHAEYNSLKEAAAAVGASKEGLRSFIDGKRKKVTTFKGYFWRWKGSVRMPGDGVDMTRPNRPKRTYKGHKPVEQIDLETQMVVAQFESASQAAEVVGNSPGISLCLNGKANHCRGFFWRLVGSDAMPAEGCGEPKFIQDIKSSGKNLEQLHKESRQVIAQFYSMNEAVGVVGADHMQDFYWRFEA
jgi:hypothetical protein